MKILNILAFLLLLWMGTSSVLAQQNGVLKGRVTFEDKNIPVHGVIILITQIKVSTTTDDDGRYEIKNVPAGSYNVMARLDRVPDIVRRIDIAAGQEVVLDIELTLIGTREQVTISATGHQQAVDEAYQSVLGIDSTALLEKDPSSLGEALERYPGIAKRSAGPGSSRPVIRGFDGDRVLIAQDGIRTGSLSYSSGDHGEPINLLSVDRVEVVRGPATLLYGSSSIGGMVNAVSGHDRTHEGVHGFFTTTGGTTNNLRGASGGLEFGTERWMVWGNGGGQRADDYRTPLGRILNSKTYSYDVNGGGGYFGRRGYLTASYGFNKNVFGIPVDPAEEDPEFAELNPRRHNLRINSELRELRGPVDHIHLTFDYSDYKHEELVGGEPETQFFNKTMSYRMMAGQTRKGIFSGSFGFSGFRRDFETIGEESLAPPTVQNSFSAFALENFDFKRISFQLGARVEHNGYDTVESDRARNRSFTGFSGSAGVRVPVWEGGTIAANYTRSYRAPSLDELYNFGPHPGNLTYEIGDTNLKREAADGIDLSLRHSSDRFRGEIHYFYYNLHDFIFLAPTGEVDDDLPVAEYKQADSRFMGTEVDLGVGLHRSLWLNAGLDYVNAELRAAGTPLPRIPPLRGRIGLDYQYKSFRFAPEVVLARDQERIFDLETRTPGYAVFNLIGSYSVLQSHAAHVFSINAFNLGNRLYFNHLSFIKNIAPEMGRGVRFTYTVRFF